MLRRTGRSAAVLRAIVGPFLGSKMAFLVTFGPGLWCPSQLASPLSTSYNVFMNLPFVRQSEQPGPWHEHLRVPEVRSQ